jgi:hypothetical protein
MGRTIWKFELEIKDTQFISMPKGAEILCVQIQIGNPCMWALVDPDAEKQDIEFSTYGTGRAVDSRPKTYVGTYQIINRMLVFHVFVHP